MKDSAGLIHKPPLSKPIVLSLTSQRKQRSALFSHQRVAIGLLAVIFSWWTVSLGNATEQTKPGSADTHSAEPSSQPPEQDAPNALDVIEAVRGGRHWVDAATDQPKSPQESLATLQIEPGYEIELFVSEPLVVDPVEIAFDEQGRMFVLEYGDYPIGPPAGEPPLSRIVMLEDSTGDGKPDRRHLFADKLDFAHSMMAFNGGLLVGEKTRLLYLQDTNGDHVADVRQSLFEGFEPAHPQMQIGCPRWGIDNWIYCTYGPGNVYRPETPGQVVQLPRKDFRFHPLSMRYEADSGLGQFGNTIDRWGRRFYCSNRNPIMTTFLPPNVLKRNPYHLVPKPFYDVGKAGGEARVFPLVAMKSNYLSHAGTHTAACGTTAYIGDLGDDDFANSIFVCEPIGHLVTRSILQSDGVRLRAERARPQNDFIASADTWFRPANLSTGPDGALYLADMYRLWVEHPKFLPPEIAAKLDWRAGDDLGRIYRIVPEATSPTQFIPPATISETVELLSSRNGWQQFLGQRLLVERQAKDATDMVRRLLDRDPSPTARLHALWTLDGLSSLLEADLVTALHDPDSRVRIDGLKLAEGYLDKPDVFDCVSSCVSDSDIQVRFQAALTLSQSDHPESTRLLTLLAIRDGRDRAFADGLLTSTKDRSGKVLAALVADRDFVNSRDANAIDLVKRLASIVGAQGDVDELSGLLRLVVAKEQGQLAWWQAAVVSGLGDGLTRYRGDRGRLSLAVLITRPPPQLADVVAPLQQVFQLAQRIAADPSQSVIDRVAAIELLTYQPFDSSAATLAPLLGSDQPVQIQQASIDAVARNGSTVASEIVLQRWSELGPTVRAIALEMLLRRTESTRLALGAMREGNLSAASLSIDQRVRLLKHPDEKIREQANELFGGAVSANRQQVARDYQRSLQLVGSVADGEKVFTRVCAACHRFDGKGHDAGPSLSDARNRSKAALLYDILDPNAKVEPQFTAYSILTFDGSVFTGLIASETSEAIVLKMADGKQQTIARGDIEQTKVSEVSLMPEGIEKDITVQQMADLLAYLGSHD